MGKKSSSKHIISIVRSLYGIAKMADIGIFASLDPVALDRACVDAIHNSPDHGKIHMEQRIAERNGTHLLDYAEHLGMGTQKYVLVTIE